MIPLWLAMPLGIVLFGWGITLGAAIVYAYRNER